MLAEEFTWDSFTKLIKQYYKLPEVTNDNQKLDLWARRYSETVNTNLCSFFAWFQWPLSKDTTDFCATLPTWNKNPLKRFEGKINGHF